MTSRFETLEPPRDALAIDVHDPPDAIVERTVQAVDQGGRLPLQAERE